MSTFTPHRVPPSSWRRWFKEGLAITTDRWAVNTSLVLLILGLLALLPYRCGSLLLGYLAPVLVAVFSVVAHSADTSRPLRHLFREALPGVGRVGLCAAVFIAILFAEIGAIVGMLMLLGPALTSQLMPSLPTVQTSDFPIGEGALASLFFWLVVPYTFFLVPLLACARLPAKISVCLAMDADDINPFIWKVSALTGVACLFASFWHGVAAVPFLPFVGAMMYIAYRHVFLDEPPKLEITAISHAMNPGRPD